jgi:hypothetical protein
MFEDIGIDTTEHATVRNTYSERSGQGPKSERCHKEQSPDQIRHSPQKTQECPCQPARHPAGSVREAIVGGHQNTTVPQGAGSQNP